MLVTSRTKSLFSVLIKDWELYSATVNAAHILLAIFHLLIELTCVFCGHGLTVYLCSVWIQ